ncbi:hypothetical protein [Nostoc sp.]|uniref:hypothetical protein n=1 Tax=Nostoc sp. TaxID=1180 RepID=UPI002FFC34C8
MRAVFADTGLLYAAVDVDDQYHQRSQAELQRINTERFNNPSSLSCLSGNI